MTMENKRRDKLLSQDAGLRNEAEERQREIMSGLKDMTDRENLAFRYAP